MATTLTRRQVAEAVEAQLRAVGPQTLAEIQSDLGLTKREVEATLYLLVATGRVEHDYPTRAPMAYKVTVMREP